MDDRRNDRADRPPVADGRPARPGGLIGRDAELGLLAGLIGRARGSVSGALLVTGPAGVGKSALLEAASEMATGFSALRARGVEDESEVAFSGLYELLAPILDLRTTLPAPQREALEGALALGPATGSDRFAVSVATLGMLGAKAEATPLLVLVDDLQWVDEVSVAAILFSLRRLGAEGIAAIATRRDGPGADQERRGLDELALPPLGSDEAAELLAAHSRRPVSPEAARAIVAEAGGNPLVIVQAARLLSADQLHGDEPLHGPLPIPEAMTRSLERSAARLGDTVCSALTVVAAAGADNRLEVVAAALAERGLDLNALEEAEAAGLVRIGQSSVELVDPLMRSVVYQRASPHERREAHAALARSLPGPQGAERRAWHLAEAAIGPDAQTAAALAEAGSSASARGGHAAAALALERSAALTSEPSLRARRLVASAKEANLAGRPDRAIELAERALAIDDDVARTDAVHVRARVRAWSAPLADVHAALVAEAERVAGDEPARAARMLADAALPLVRAGDVESGLATARRAAEVAAEAGRDPASAELVLAVSLIVSGRASEAAPLVDRWVAILGDEDPNVSALEPWQALPRALVWIERYEEARRLLESFLSHARRCAPGALPFALATLAELDFRTGRLGPALAGSSEGATLARDMGQTISAAFCLAGLARVSAVLGRDGECREAATEAMRIGARLGSQTPIRTLGAPGLGLLALGRGDPAAAVGYLEPVAAASDARGMREPAMVQYRPNLVEALIRVDRRDEAERALVELERQAEATGRTWALATAARCRGLLGDDAGAVQEQFSAALDWHDRTPTPFERARTELCFGERLRRARRRADAREHLRGALAAFDELGARPWAELAQRELAVSGETVRRRSDPRSDELTPQELQVALCVAAGATNKEAAAALFLSAKTIEAHLGRVYRKLGVRSRTELAARASGGELGSA